MRAIYNLKDFIAAVFVRAAYLFVCNAGSSAQLFQGNHFSVLKLDGFIAAFVLRLLQERRPSAITWLIISVHIDSLKCAAIWALPHVGKETEELFPPIAHRYSPPSVIDILKIGASPDHRAPCSISWALRFCSSRMAVALGAIKAATTSSVATSKASRRECSERPAFTKTEPGSFNSSIHDGMNDGKPPKSHPGNVDFIWHIRTADTVCTE